jgi:hypothetical protein
MNLYYVRAGAEGGDLDLFVRCKSTAQAMVQWRKYYHIEPSINPEGVFRIDEFKKGALPWYDPWGAELTFPKQRSK